jgi:transcriptional regulatory protein RtcR
VRCTADLGRAVRFNAEAKALYLRLAQAPEALWSGNFRDLAASVTRLCTLADGGRISTELVEAEWQRLRWLWQMNQPTGRVAEALGEPDMATLMPAGEWDKLDLFDRLQLSAVVRVCRASRTLSEAGRTLFNQSRAQRAVVNDADRLRKYLQKHGLRWDALQ